MTRKATIRLDPHPASARAARRFVEHALAQWHQPEAVCNVATLLASELVTNALLHARSGMDLAILLDDGDRGVVVEVHDHSPRRPEMRPFSSTSTSGRGLAM